MLLKRKAKRVRENLLRKTSAARISQKGLGTEVPPQKKLVEIYFDQKGFTAQAGVFYDFYEQADWCSPKGTPYRNWKSLASDWIFDFEQSLKLRKRRRENALLDRIL
jgi:hypothetical protein